jgi:hypothetical protein
VGMQGTSFADHGSLAKGRVCGFLHKYPALAIASFVDMNHRPTIMRDKRTVSTLLGGGHIRVHKQIMSAKASQWCRKFVDKGCTQLPTCTRRGKC